MDAIRRDLRLALRGLGKSRLFAVVAILMLALGIGVNTAIFSLTDAVAFKPLPFADPGRLVGLHEWSATKLCAGCGVGTSYPGFLEWRSRTTSFSALGAYTELPAVVSAPDIAERVPGAVVSAEVFPVLGVHPVLGRGVLPEEDRAGGAPVVLLGYELWQRRFAGDSGVIGKRIRVNGSPYTVVGVMPPRFSFPEFAQLWLPLAQAAHDAPRSARDYDVVARLRPGIGIARAQAEMTALAASLAERYPDTQKEWTAQVRPFRRDYAGDEAGLFGVMLGAVTFVLLIVCANVAGLMLVRGTSRQKEIAIRLALGAGRGVIVRQLMAESLLIAAAGGIVGVFIAWWVADLAVASLHTLIPFWINFGIDGRALAFSGALTLGTGVLFGLLPALRASRPDVQSSLKEGGTAHSGSVARSRIRSVLVVGELALSMVLLAGAGVLIKSFLSVSIPETGYDPRGVLKGELEFLDARYADRAQVASAGRDILAHVSRLPGVTSAALSRWQFIAGFGGADQRIRAEGISVVPDGASPRFFYAVTPEYFSTLRLPSLQGRLLSAADHAGAPPVAVINLRMARALWPNESAIGKRIRLGPADSLPWLTIVGVVGDSGRGERTTNYAYVPFAQSPGRPTTLHTRIASSASSALEIVPALRGEIRAVDPDLPLVDVKTLEQDHHDSFWPYEMYALFMSAFAALAVLLAAIGLYGLVAFAVAQRTREIGVRVALGAQRVDVLRLVTGQGLRLAMLGVVLGIVGSLGLLRLLKSMLFGASPIVPFVFGTVSLLLGGVALLASYIPARRAAGVDPLVALRSE
jgi:predicted permease